MLRDYQVKAIDEIRYEFIRGKRKVLLWLATGAGKTVVFCEMIKSADAKGLRTLVVVRGRKLVDQASQRLFREKVHHGVLMAGHWNYRPHFTHQVASIDTLLSRKMKPQADLIIIDEAHLATSEGYREFLAQYDTYVVAVTATPYVNGGLSHVAQSIVHPITMQELIDQGYLVPFRYFAPSEPDLTEVKVSPSTKDYVVDQLEGAMVAGQLTGKIVDHWKKLAENRPTICFAVNVHHSKVLVEKFLEAGIPAEHCDAETPDNERNEVIKRVETGVTKVVCNVGIFCTGIDIPCIGAIIMARPTKSKNLFVQQCGRGTRTFEGKTNCILLDHSGNLGRHGLPTDEPEVDLHGREKTNSHVKESKICKACFAVFRGKLCPQCKVETPQAPLVIPEETEDELVELELQRESDPLLRQLKSLQWEATRTKKKPAWAFYRFVEKVGYELAKPYLPPWFQGLMDQDRSDYFRYSPFKAYKKA